MSPTFQDNTSKSRFEYHVDDAVVFANYRREKDTLFIDYVEAPDVLRGTGAAGKLMQYIADKATEEKLSIIPICGYAAAWLRKHQK